MKQRRDDHLYVVVEVALALLLLLLQCSLGVNASCPIGMDDQICSGHGNCDSATSCVCYHAYQGYDCSKLKCPFGIAWSGPAMATDTIHVPSECSNRGVCERETGTCICDSGFTGSACDRMQCPSDCSKKGLCISMKELAKHNPWGEDRLYDSIWDADKIYGCECTPGRRGPDCSRLECPRGDDPLTIGQVNEKQLIVCTATSGYFFLFFNGDSITVSHADTLSTFKAKLSSLPTIGKIDVTFSAGSTVCNAGTMNTITVEFLSRFGQQPHLKAYQTAHGQITLNAEAVLAVGVAGTALGNEVSVVGTKENEECSNRGYCNEFTGVCQCYRFPPPGFLSSDGYGRQGNRGDCGFADDDNGFGKTIQFCPGEVPCSGHGVCSGPPSYSCTCALGWQSGDCSARSCPADVSWFHRPTSDNHAHNIQASCSDVGKCDRITGECDCTEPFGGPACQYLNCPGWPTRCSGHGRCLTLAQLASESVTTQGDDGFFTYGENANDPHTWDAKKIHACSCDDGYEGHDCNSKSCPTGDDPMTLAQVDEIQVLRCMGTLGSFQLGFRRAMTAAIPYDATAAQVEAFLEDLSTITDVDVTFSDGTSACTTLDRTNYLSITFTEQHGDVPDLKTNIAQLRYLDSSSGHAEESVPGSFEKAFDGAILGGIASVMGTKEEIVCSRHGHCDSASGNCLCQPGFGPSDGKGNEGTKNDCGYILPFVR